MDECPTFQNNEFYVGIDFLYRPNEEGYEIFETYYETGTEKKLMCFSKGLVGCPHCAAASYYPSHLSSGIHIREPYYLVSDEFGSQELFRVTDEVMLKGLGVPEEEMESKLKEVQEKMAEADEKRNEQEKKNKKPNLTIVS